MLHGAIKSKDAPVDECTCFEMYTEEMAVCVSTEVFWGIFS